MITTSDIFQVRLLDFDVVILSIDDDDGCCDVLGKPHRATRQVRPACGFCRYLQKL